MSEQGWIVFYWYASYNKGGIYLSKGDVIDRTYDALLSDLTVSAQTSPLGVSISPNGRFVVFDSAAVFDDHALQSSARKVYRVDLGTGRLDLISRAVDGGPNGDSSGAVVSDDGTVVFTSTASNLVAGDANAQPDIFMGRGAEVMLLSRGLNGAANGGSRDPDISSDGRFVVFTSDATNLVPDDLGGNSDVFRERLSDLAIQIVSAPRSGESANGNSYGPAINGDGSVVVFSSDATNLGEAIADRFSGLFIARF